MRFDLSSRSSLRFKLGAGVLLSAMTLFVAIRTGEATAGNVACDSAAWGGAIDAANATPAADELQLAKGCTYTLTARSNSFYRFNGLPTLTTPVTIIGNGATIQRDPSAPSFRLIAVDSTGSLRLVGVNLHNGLAKGGNGGSDRGIEGAGNTDDGGGGGGGAGLGGAIYNKGALTVAVSTISGNAAKGGDGGAGADNTGEDGGGGAGGGGLGGNGGNSAAADDGGAGGGGFGGNGGAVGEDADTGAGGGGTVSDGGSSVEPTSGPDQPGLGGAQNGGNGGSEVNDDGDAGGAGGGGGGAADEGTGGAGGIGGGGGGAGENDEEDIPTFGGAGGFGGG